jgi:hypothetical protein
MVTVATLRNLLTTLPDHLTIAMAHIDRQGLATDTTTWDITTITPAINDNGDITTIWLVGINPADHPTPPLVEWSCRCGTHTVVATDGYWHDHNCPICP